MEDSHLQICSNCVVLLCQQGLKSRRNVSSNFLNLHHEELSQKRVRPSTSKEYLMEWRVMLHVTTRLKGLVTAYKSKMQWWTGFWVFFLDFSRQWKKKQLEMAVIKKCLAVIMQIYLFSFAKIKNADSWKNWKIFGSQISATWFPACSWTFK